MVGTALDAQGGVSAVITTLKEGGLFERCNVEHLVTHRDGGWGTKVAVLVAAWARLVRRLARGDVGALHVHTSSRASFWRKVLFILPAVVWRIPYLLHLHGAKFHEFYAASRSPSRRVIRFVFERACCVIVLSHAWRAWAQNTFPNANIRVVYNPVVLPARGVPPSHEISAVVSLGQVGGRKGTPELISAFAIVARRFPACTLLIGGDGDIKGARQLADDLGLAGRVELLGWVKGEKKAALLASATVYALPSYNEGLPVSVLEAMAAGLPVVSTPVGGIPEVVTDGVEGYLIQPGDVESLADRICQLLGDAQLRHKMGAAARAKVVASFSVECIVPQLEAIYAEFGILSGLAENATSRARGHDIT